MTAALSFGFGITLIRIRIKRQDVQGQKVKRFLWPVCDEPYPSLSSDTPGLSLCLGVKAARRAPPNSLHPYNHHRTFFFLEQDETECGEHINNQTSNWQRPHGAKGGKKRERERETVNKPFGMAAAETAHMCYD